MRYIYIYIYFSTEIPDRANGRSYRIRYRIEMVMEVPAPTEMEIPEMRPVQHLVMKRKTM